MCVSLCGIFYEQLLWIKGCYSLDFELNVYLQNLFFVFPSYITLTDNLKAYPRNQINVIHTKLAFSLFSSNNLSMCRVILQNKKQIMAVIFTNHVFNLDLEACKQT